MDKCLCCGESDGELLTIVEDGRSEPIDGQICKECETELVWTGVEVGPAGTCGYSDRCNRMVTYSSLETDAEGGQTRNNLVCGYHLSKLES